MLGKYLLIWIISWLYCKFPDGKGQIWSVFLIGPNIQQSADDPALTTPPDGCSQVHFHRRIQPRMTTQHNLKDSTPDPNANCSTTCPSSTMFLLWDSWKSIVERILTEKKKNYNGWPCLSSSYCLLSPVLGSLYKLSQYDAIICQHLQKWLNGDLMKL